MTKKDSASVQIAKPVNLAKGVKIVLLACTEEEGMLFLRKRAVIVILGCIKLRKEVQNVYQKRSCTLIFNISVIRHQMSEVGAL